MITAALLAAALWQAPAAEQQAAMARGETTAEALTRDYLARIEAMNRKGPKLNAVIAVMPDAVAQAKALDAERKAGRVRGPLHGVTVLVKDNIEAKGAATTAGSLALRDNAPGRDAPLTARLRAAGAVVIGKANLSEWANFRSTRSISGWSAVGGLTRNPYALDRLACGSSSGSAAGVAAGFAALAVGTETDGSITCPAAMNGVVGLKPTVGLISRRLVIPIAESQDTPGPMARNVTDAAALLGVLAGTDPDDPATSEADARKTDYLAALKPGALAGARIGVWRGVVRRSPGVDAAFEAALERMRTAGAVLVEVARPDESAVGAGETTVLRAEFKAGIAAYLAGTKGPHRSLADLIAFGRTEPRETALFGQEVFEAAEAAPGVESEAYRKALADARRLAGPEGLDPLLAKDRLDAIAAPAGSPAGVAEPVNEASWLGSPSTLPAVAGYPHLVVPMGMVEGLPVGLSLIGPAWSEARLLALGYAFEQAGPALPAPTFPPTVSGRTAFDP